MYRLLRNPRLRYGCATAGIAGAGIWAVNARESPLPAGLHTGPRSFLAPLGISTPALSLWPGGNSLFGAPGWFSSRGEDSLSRALEEALGPAGSSSPEQPPPRARFIRKRGPVSSEGTLVRYRTASVLFAAAARQRPLGIVRFRLLSLCCPLHVNSPCAADRSIARCERHSVGIASSSFFAVFHDGKFCVNTAQSIGGRTWLGSHARMHVSRSGMSWRQQRCLLRFFRRVAAATAARILKAHLRISHVNALCGH